MPFITDILSKMALFCGDSASAAIAGSNETIEYDRQGTLFAETILTWRSTSAASQSITAMRQVLDYAGCTVGETKYSGVYSWSPSADCVDPGQYLATEGVVIDGAPFPYEGYLAVAQCGTTTIAAVETDDLPGSYPSQTHADSQGEQLDYLGLNVIHRVREVPAVAGHPRA